MKAGRPELVERLRGSKGDEVEVSHTIAPSSTKKLEDTRTPPIARDSIVSELGSWGRYVLYILSR